MPTLKGLCVILAALGTALCGVCAFYKIWMPKTPTSVDIAGFILEGLCLFTYFALDAEDKIKKWGLFGPSAKKVELQS